jgi:hypothetical protein
MLTDEQVKSFRATAVAATSRSTSGRGDLSLDESFLPVLWDENGGRSAWLAELPALA